MHYFPGWTEEAIMNMSYDKFTAYLASIPDYSTDDNDDDSETDKSKTKKPSAKAEKAPVTGSFNLFDLDERK